MLAALALLAVGRGALAQDPNSSFGSPSILPLPQTRSIVPAGYQSSPPQTSQIQQTAATTTGSLGGYRQAMANSQPAADPALASPADVGPSTAETIGSGMNTNPWWKPWGNNNSTGQGVPSAMACGSEAGCLSCNPCCGGGGARWFGSVGGIFMTRNMANPYWTTYNTLSNPDQLLNSKQAGNGLWGGGGQVTFGRWWCPCGCNPCSCGPRYAYGVQFTYWQLADMSSSATVFSATGNLGTTMDMTATPVPSFPAGAPAGTAVDPYFDGAYRQTIWRTDRFLNIELNGLLQPIYNNPGCFSCTLLGGFRYFRFQDVLTYGSAKDPSGDFNAAGGADAAYLQSNCTNNLFGAQIGTLLNFAVTPRFGLFVLPKAGVFGNQINITNTCYTGQNLYAFNLHASQTVCSLLGELDSGAYWWMGPNAQLFFGWRVIGVSNVALADNQFLQYLGDTKGYQTVKSNGEVILTGGFGGVAFAF
jgi:hypothetical protein